MPKRWKVSGNILFYLRAPTLHKIVSMYKQIPNLCYLILYARRFKISEVSLLHRFRETTLLLDLLLVSTKK